MRKSFKFNKLSLINLLIFLPIVFPTYITTIGNVRKIIPFLKVLSTLLMLLMIFSKYKKYKPSFYIWALGLFLLELIFSTVLNGSSSIVSVLSYTIPILLSVIYFDTLNYEELVLVLKSLVGYLFLLVFINFISVLLFPKGIYDVYYLSGALSNEYYYFLGHNNSTVKIAVPAIILSAILDYLTKNKIGYRTIILALITMVTVTITWSNTAMLGVFIILAYLIGIKSIEKKPNKTFFKINYKVLFGIPIAIFLLIIVFNKVDIFSTIIVNVFHKDTDLTGRTFIWNSAKNAIIKNPIFGYGYGVHLYDVIKMNIMPSSCHNYFLDILFRGGIVHFLLNIIISYMACKKLSESKSKISNVLVGFLLAYFIMWQVEPFINVGVELMYILFLLCYNIKRIDFMVEEQNEKRIDKDNNRCS